MNIGFDAEMISGAMVGIEFIDGSDIYEDDTTYYLSIDLLFVRVVVSITKE
jgi:hypothetical protein